MKRTKINEKEAGNGPFFKRKERLGPRFMESMSMAKEKVIRSHPSHLKSKMANYTDDRVK